MRRMILLFAVALAAASFAGDRPIGESLQPEKPMKVFVEIDGRLFEVMIARSSSVADRASDDIQRRFRGQARKYGFAYLQEKLVLVER